MKIRTALITGSLLAVLAIQGCKKEFLNRPPIDQPTAPNFYNTDDEILAGTGPLYNASWHPYNGTPLQYIGDILGGNSLDDNYAGRGAYLTFTVPGSNGELGASYSSFWSVVSNANIVAYNIIHAPAGASESAKNAGLAECRFMRATAYYYLVLNFGEVPIIYDNTTQIGDSTIRRNNLDDDWKFMIMDLTWAKNNLPIVPAQNGRISKWTAEGMLARAYLIRSGLNQSGGTRNQSDLDSAKFYAGDVCNNSGIELWPNYYELFTSKYFSGNNNNPEALFGLQWVPSGNYFVQNGLQSNLAYDSKITQTGDGWGGSFGASPSLMQYYMDPANKADSVRRKATFFLPGDYYPDINQANGGWHVDTTLFNNAKIYNPGEPGNGYGNDRAYVKKYVIGSPADNGGLGGTQNENINTYMFRLAEVYLIYANAILGNNASTSDPEALKFFNKVRTRAGIAPKASITYADIFQEKKVEFAFEGHTWYDWREWYYFDPSAAMNYFNTQNRGSYNISYNSGKPFVTYFGSDGLPGVVHYSITPATAKLPYPESEILSAPNLLLDPVPFDFSKLSY